MKLILSFLFQITLVSLAFSQASDSRESAIAKSKALLDNAISQQKCVGISAGVSVNGVIEWKDAAGYADKDNKTLYKTQTLTRTASIAKPMTAVAIMQLVEKNLLDIEAPINNYLDNFPNGNKITTRHLLSHISGMDAYKSKKEVENKKHYPTLTQAADVFKDRKLLAEPGTAFNYTSYGYVVLGMIIESASGQSYEAYMQEHILDKVGMTHTGVEHFGQDYQDQAALYHIEKKGKIKSKKSNDLSNRIPAGGFYSTVEDLLAFGNALMSGELISAASFDMMKVDCGLKKEGNGYGLGFYLYGMNDDFGEIVGHTGAQTGSSTFIMLLPDVSTSVVVLSNTSGALQEVSNIIVNLYHLGAKMSTATDAK